MAVCRGEQDVVGCVCAWQQQRGEHEEKKERQRKGERFIVSSEPLYLVLSFQHLFFHCCGRSPSQGSESL